MFSWLDFICTKLQLVATTSQPRLNEPQQFHRSYLNNIHTMLFDMPLSNFIDFYLILYCGSWTSYEQSEFSLLRIQLLLISLNPHCILIHESIVVLILHLSHRCFYRIKSKDFSFYIISLILSFFSCLVLLRYWAFIQSWDLQSKGGKRASLFYYYVCCLMESWIRR